MRSAPFGARSFSPYMEKAYVLKLIEESASPYVLGIDEVGLGAIAGPVTVGAVVLPKDWKHKGVKDSKRLSPKKREEAVPLIQQNALCYCILSAENKTIDEKGIYVVLADLVTQCVRSLLPYFPGALVVQDGIEPVPLAGITTNVAWMPKADAHITAVSAASILAKVHRDAYMMSISYTYPGYELGTNMGYPTPSHKKAVQEMGMSPLHRRSYKLKP